MTNIAFALLLSLILTPNVLSERSLFAPIRGLTSATSDAPLPLTSDAEDVLIRDGWVQEGPPSQTITAAYMKIENHTGSAVSLRSASSEVAQAVELHQMELIDGMMKMRRVDTIDIPAGGTVDLKPGGYHLMVIGLKKELKQGDKVTISLQFSNEIRKTITIPVKPRSAMVKEG